MPSGRADILRAAGRPRWWAAGLALCLVIGAGIFLLVRQSPKGGPDGSGSGASSATETDGGRADAAGELLHALGERLESGTRQQVLALAAPDDERAGRELLTLRSNVRNLGVTDLSMRYLAEDAGRTSAGERQRGGHDAWVADVQLRWRLRGFDMRSSVLELPMAFRDLGGRAAFVTARHDYGGAAPLWVLERVSVRRTARSLVVTSGDHRVERFSRLADRAVGDVRKVLVRWPGRLVVEVPASQDRLTRVLGAEPRAYAELAALTTTADGSRDPGAPVHIFVNPWVFERLGARGSQIVLSHEAAHVATRAAFSSMPVWLLEGFADYVALTHVDLPVSVTASQVLAEVRRSGPPSRLPGRGEFDPENGRLGASYESAWLACRLLAETYGERRLVRFYRAADRASSTRLPFRTVLGTDQRAFTRAWRDDLRRLAG